MSKTITISVAALAFSMLSCDDGGTRVDRRIDCIQICRQVENCVGDDDFDRDDCKEQCNDDATDEAVDECENCLTNEDSCREDLSCADECGGVLASGIFD